jgi:ABC-type glutathione transport system ATPase component
MGVHAAMTDRLGIMYAGRLVEDGATPTIFERPQHPYTPPPDRSLPRIGDVKQREGLEGKPPNLAIRRPAAASIRAARSPSPVCTENGAGWSSAARPASPAARSIRGRGMSALLELDKVGKSFSRSAGCSRRGASTR